MIQDFADKSTAALFTGLHVRRFPEGIQLRARTKLLAIHAAIKLDDLRIPTSNHLELLRGDRATQYSIRINNQWRICFTWRDGNAYDVEIIDYHKGHTMTISMNELSGMDFSDVADYSAPRIPHIHAGQVLNDDFLQPLGISKYGLAKAIGVSAPRIGDIVAGRRGVSADTALRLARYLGTSADFWLNLQAGYDLETTASIIASDLSHIQPLHA